MKSIYISLFVGLSILMTGCGGSISDSNQPEAETPPAIEAKNNIVVVSIVDGAGKFVKDASVSFNGLALDIENNDISNKVIKTDASGLVSFYSEVGKNVKLLVSKANYINTGAEFTITADVNDKKIVLIEFKQENAPAGVTLASADVTAATNGSTSEEEVVEASGMVITIPEGTILKTANGEPVTGSVSLQTAFYEPTATESFPGGLNVVAAGVPADNGSGTADEAVDFVSAGFTSVQMVNQDGDEVKNFENGEIEIAMSISQGTINPETGAEVAVGDEIPIWSYDDKTGKWSYEEMGTVQIHPTDPTSFAVIYQASHLSYWNLDWHQSASCKVHIDISDLSQGTTTVTSLKLKGQGFSKSVFDYNGDGFYDLDNVPSKLPLTVELFYDGELRDSKSNILFNDIECKTSLSVGSVAVKEPVKITVFEQCSNGTNKVVVPYVPTYLLSGGAWTYLSATATNGELDVMLDPGSTVSTRLYAFGSSSRYTNSFNYLTIPAGVSTDQEIIFTLGAQYNDYCAILDDSTD